jgi:organic hydroperoxide reductase OsmC/OhrA
VRILAAAVGHCLSASALFCLQKARVVVHRMRTDVEAATVRDERGRLRVSQIRVQLRPQIAGPNHARVRRCLDLFEDYCVVTQSVRSGIDVNVDVRMDDRPSTTSQTTTEAGAEPGRATH